MTTVQRRNWVTQNSRQGCRGGLIRHKGEHGCGDFLADDGKRILCRGVIYYCLDQVRYLPGLVDVYLSKLVQNGLQAQVQTVRAQTEQRMVDAQEEKWH